MDLKKYLDKIETGSYMEPKLVKSYLYQINEAILFCHQRRVLHRDLKPQNLLITKDGVIKVRKHSNILIKLYLRQILGCRFWFGTCFWGTRKSLHPRSRHFVV